MFIDALSPRKWVIFFQKLPELFYLPLILLLWFVQIFNFLGNLTLTLYRVFVQSLVSFKLHFNSTIIFLSVHLLFFIHIICFFNLHLLLLYWHLRTNFLFSLILNLFIFYYPTFIHDPFWSLLISSLLFLV